MVPKPILEWFRGGLCSTMLTVGLDLKGLVQPK